AWATETLLRQQFFAAFQPHSGCSIGDLSLLFENRASVEAAIQRELWWTSLPSTFVDGASHLTIDATPNSSVEGASFDTQLRARVPIVDMSIHMPFLVGTALQLGVQFQPMNDWLTHAQLADVDDCDGVIVCCGGWSPGLLNKEDLELRGFSGELIRCECRDARFQKGAVLLAHLQDSRRPIYMVSTHDRRSVWIGGTVFDAEFDADGRKPATSPDEHARIRKQAGELLGDDSALGTDILETRIGVRPYRGEVVVRHEFDNRSGVPVISNYGHGGGGVSLSWGTANEAIRVLELAPRGESVSQDLVHFD
ncbi:MAG: FAD-dependent oxidoreductase, partial [Planctomycetota bacterium]